MTYGIPKALIPCQDASHGHWYYNGHEFGGIFKV